MLKGLTTLTLWANDVPAAAHWYSELLGFGPYFTSEAAGRGPGYAEFRLGDDQHELGIIDRRFAPPGLHTERGGAVCYWHVDDVAVALERLRSLGAEVCEPMKERGPGFVTASVYDPFGNVLGVMFNRHFLDVRRHHRFEPRA